MNATSDTAGHAPQSDPRDLVVLVDDADRELGTMDKVEAHRGAGRLHRAITCLLFDDQGHLLFARRAPDKPLWPGFYDATVATHPLPSEDSVSATQRRIQEELSVQPYDVIRLSDINYHAQYNEDWSEREVCAVLLARFEGSPKPVMTEIDDVVPVSATELAAFLHQNPIAPWFQLAWKALQQEQATTIGAWHR